MFSVREPFYFYHLLPDNVRLNKDRIVSPEYWFRKGDTIQYLKCVDKYRVRLCKDWKIYPNLKPEDLTPIQIYNGLNIFRNDKDGNNRIYLFKYPPYKDLGPNMSKVLDSKRIFQIDIESGLSRQYIKKIDYGYWLSDSRNRKLNRHYYINITEDDYFYTYNDSDYPLFKGLNHIAIIPRLTYLPLMLWEEIEVK